jgi:hypothetical protein
MRYERDVAVVSHIEQGLPRGELKPESGRISTQRAQQYISFNIARWVNTSAPEFPVLRTYVHQLGQANHDEEHQDPAEAADRQLPKTSIVTPEQVHITSIYSFDAHELLVRAFGDDDGRITKIKKVKQNVRGLQRHYEQKLRKRNNHIQNTVVADIEASNRRFGECVQTDLRQSSNAVLRMTSGLFDTEAELRAFGDGRKFGLVFDEEAEQYLSEERAVSLDFILTKLRISSIDQDLEDRILGRKHHATLIKNGGLSPHSLTYPEDEEGDILSAPEVLVTELEPKMRYIDGRDTRTT